MARSLLPHTERGGPEGSLDMLALREELEGVAWAEVEHAYGPATDTPGHLLALLSRDPAERYHALDELWGPSATRGTYTRPPAPPCPS